MSNTITCNNYQYTNSDIFSGDCYLGNSLAAEELSIDTLDVSLNVGPAQFVTTDGYAFQTADGVTYEVQNPISGYKYGDPVTYKNDNTLVGKFYFEKAQRKGPTKYDFSNISAMGLLDNITHYGGIYIEVPAGNIIADIMVIFHIRSILQFRRF